MSLIWGSFLNYSTEILFGAVLIYNCWLAYDQNFATHKNTVDGDELLRRYFKLMEKRRG